MGDTDSKCWCGKELSYVVIYRDKTKEKVCQHHAANALYNSNVLTIIPIEAA